MKLLRRFKKVHEKTCVKVIHNKKGVSMVQALGVSIAISLISVTIMTIVLNNSRMVANDVISSPASIEARASVDQAVYKVERFIENIDMTEYTASELDTLFKTNLLPTVEDEYGVTVVDVSDEYNGTGTDTTSTGQYSSAYRFGAPVGSYMIYKDVLISSSGSDGLSTSGGTTPNPEYISESIYTTKRLMIAGGTYLEADMYAKNFSHTAYPLKYYNSYNMPDSLFELGTMVKFNYPTVTSDSTIQVTNSNLWWCNAKGSYYNYYEAGCANYNKTYRDLYGEEYLNTAWANQLSATSAISAAYFDMNNDEFDTIASSNIKTSVKDDNYTYDMEQYALDVLANAASYLGDDLTFANAYTKLLAAGFEEYDYSDVQSLKGNASSFAYQASAGDLNGGYIVLEDRLKFKDDNNVAYIDGNGYTVKFAPSKKNETYNGVLVVNGDLVIDIAEIPRKNNMLIIVNGNVTFENSKDGMYFTNDDTDPLYVVATGNIDFSSWNRNSYKYNSRYFRQTAGNNFEYQLHAYLIAGGSITAETLTSDFISMVGGMYAFGNTNSTAYNDLAGIVLTSYRKTVSGSMTADSTYARFIFHDIDFDHNRDYLPNFMYEYIDSGGSESNYYISDFNVISSKDF